MAKLDTANKRTHGTLNLQSGFLRKALRYIHPILYNT